MLTRTSDQSVACNRGFWFSTTLPNGLGTATKKNVEELTGPPTDSHTIPGRVFSMRGNPRKSIHDSQYSCGSGRMASA